MRRRFTILESVSKHGNVVKACRYYGISRDTYYRWKRNYEAKGLEGLICSKPCPQNPKIRLSKEKGDKILELRKNYHLGGQRIVWYKEHVNVLQIYNKKTPGHHVQVDVKFLFLKGSPGCTVKRFQYTVIDNATRVCVFKIYGHDNSSS